MTSLLIAPWDPFMSVAAEAAATLTGLVFVAVSINLRPILDIPGLTSLVAESLVQLLGAAFLALAVLIPQQSGVVLGIEVLLLVAALWLIQLTSQVAYLRADTGHPLQWAATRVLRTACASLPFLIAGVMLVRGSTTGMDWMTLGVFFSIIAGVSNAWVLLVEVAR